MPLSGRAAAGDITGGFDIDVAPAPGPQGIDLGLNAVAEPNTSPAGSMVILPLFPGKDTGEFHPGHAAGGGRAYGDAAGATARVLRKNAGTRIGRGVPW